MSVFRLVRKGSNKKLLKKSYFIFGLFSIFILGIVSIPMIFAQPQPIKSIEIFSEKLDYNKEVPGSWKVEKSAKWISKGVAEITFAVESILKTKYEYYDVLFVLDTSDSMEGNKISKVKDDAKELIDEILSKSENNIGIITFDTTSSIVSEFTNDKDTAINKLNSIGVQGNTNYYDALVNVDSILNNYVSEDDRGCIVLFLTDGFPNVNTPSEIVQYEYLKKKYPFAIINGVQYEMGSKILEPIKKVTDNQYVADMSTLHNTLFEAALAPISYDEFVVEDLINSNHFYLSGVDDIHVNYGTVNFDNNTQKFVWNLNKLITGRKVSLTAEVKLKEEFTDVDDIYPTNENEKINSGIGNIFEDITSVKTPLLKNMYNVSYDENAPSGCKVDNVPKDRKYFVFDTVGISESALKCEGYQFKGWKIVTNEVEKVNDDYFVMPEKDVLIRANWSKLNVEKSMDGTIQEKLTLYKQVEMDAANKAGAVNYSGSNFSFTGDYPVYMYNNVTAKNNVLFGGFCWKMVRTTDTGGIKILYNGLPDSNGRCNNSGESSLLTNYPTDKSKVKSRFNRDAESVSDVGYMYNTRYQTETEHMIDELVIINNRAMSSTENYSYFYSDEFEYKNNFYYLTDAAKTDWSTDNKDLVGKYTCGTATSSICSTLLYIVNADSDYIYYVSVGGGKDVSSRNLTVTFSDSVELNGDGTYTLTNPVVINRADWIENYSSYINYYTCANNNVVCEKPYLILSTNRKSIMYTYNYTPFKFGNSFIWDGNNYTLTDTKDVFNWLKEYWNIDDFHYTCFNENGVCSEISYVFFTAPYYANYIKLSDGKNVDDALNEMLYNDDVNKNDSTIKQVLDLWYINNLSSYTNYLEDTVWCNDRRTLGRSSSGWNPNGGSMDSALEFGRSSDYFSCVNRNDRFTTNFGVGNGALTYPIGLLTDNEAIASKDSLGFDQNEIWLLTPAKFYRYYSTNIKMDSRTTNSVRYTSAVSNSYYLRPAISLKSGISYVSGDGSTDTPYIVDLDENIYKIEVASSLVRPENQISLGRQKIRLLSLNENKYVVSFKLNGKLVKGSTFVMPESDVKITDVILGDLTILESEHYPYPSRKEIGSEKTFEGATSLTVELFYETADSNQDRIYLRDKKNKEYGFFSGAGGRKVIEIPGDYVKVVFNPYKEKNNHYGYKAAIIPNYD